MSFKTSLPDEAIQAMLQIIDHAARMDLAPDVLQKRARLFIARAEYTAELRPLIDGRISLACKIND
jgi:hypothetical protein